MYKRLMAAEFGINKNHQRASYEAMQLVVWQVLESQRLVGEFSLKSSGRLDKNSSPARISA
jgi:hypothetical protein